MGSEGRRSAKYVATRKLYRQGHLVCHICNERPGTTVDHQPPLSDFAHPDLWQGHYKPACSRCQSQQGAAIRNNTNAWQW